MPWKTDKPLVVSLRHPLCVLLVSFFLAGCATKQWTEPLQGTDAESAALLVDSLAARDALCGGTLESDLALFYQTPLEKKALSGFFQFSMPSSYKFVMTNPFGQPMLVVAGDQESFQAINTLERNYLAGSLRSFGLRNNIPGYFLKSDWGSWLTGRNQQPSQTIIDIRNDRDSRGLWFTFQSKEQKGIYRLLLDRERGLYLVRILEDKNGQTVAKITYDNWVTLGKCRQPQEINITGLDYGTDIRIELSNILLTDELKTYNFSPPSGYNRHYMQ